MKRLTRIMGSLMAGAVALSAVAAVSADGAGGVSEGAAFYVDGIKYRTVGTPTDLSNTGAPDNSFDIIYDLGGAQLNVAEAAPMDQDYNGGRWMVHAIAFNEDYRTTLGEHDLDGNDVLDSAEEVESALADAGPTGATDTGVVKSFECPVIKFPANS